ncbi:PLP-dependent aminotransferase family protein [Pseudomonas sp. ZM23]|uniref:PLP-dependent aminotransferase family protein n=1 Tax=Pseudomonas triclosanedens TaxID=2961893 RepID=A0ABY6ZRW9_9PSED|nr:PLP-dependent aminotransferase family protein [Pseudomonas triclosanedens]MCP8467021.1 PLP-dependent aminotransferase family protein [Pseudomonas triclosanedens]MCP8472831.1 PLP-dependent aminotransferase family protein [Pseudomonas triclosanedens]MCP8478262.1 PLP-dependent aminotransferase family protein [Pseudomonas triclosanedens]WAI47667.1 PLP-dependent aminotransferase family protein [Pseudomonas triclosanedens]
MAVKPIIDTVPILKEALGSGQGAKYKRLAGAMQTRILEGSIEAGMKLPPRRILADRLGVTIGTVSRAYAELERMGLVVARVGDGTFVRQRELERKRDAGFSNFVEERPEQYDMSRNMHIPGLETRLLAQSLLDLAHAPRVLAELSLYTPDAGLPRYRQAGADWLAHGDFQPQAEQVLCVNGGQHGLLCTLMALLRAGDTIVTEQLTYPGLITAARMLGIKLLGAAMDDEGLVPESLDELCRYNRVSAIYCTPTLQNPTTGVLSAQRREAIVAICREHNLLIIEDEAHAVLVEDRPPPLSLYAPERSVLISSLSKAVAAGLRVGYLHAPTTLISRIAAALRASCWMATPLAMELASNWIEGGIAENLLRQQIAEIGRRKQLVQGQLEGLSYRTHPQCPHFWIEVPEPWRASDVEAELKLKNYLIATAEAFAVGRAAVPQFVRVSVSNASHDDLLLLEGFEALANTLRSGQFDE